jgi:hypothetical protein
VSRGLQVNDVTERRVLFSVWDAGAGTVVDEVDMHQHALVRKFGGEGEGVDKCFIFYNKFARYASNPAISLGNGQAVQVSCGGTTE